MKTFNMLFAEAAENAAVSVSEVLGVYVDPRDPENVDPPTFSKCYPLGQQIRRSREGVESNFMSDVADFDKSPSDFDPYADIRSTYDERLAYSDKINDERKKRHEQRVRDSSDSIAPNGDPVSPASSDSGNQGATNTD